jgi:ElaB/YqjD/DUF883 family membrane-anchored ribosome-binding protein
MNPETDTRTGRGNGETRWDSAPGGADLNEHIEHHRAEIDRTLSALEGKLSPSDLIDDVLRNMNAGPGQFINNLGTSVRDNPIPVTLIGVGLGWLMLGQGDGTSRLRHKVGQKVGQKRENMRGHDGDTGHSSAHAGEGASASGLDDPEFDAFQEPDDEMSLPDLYAFCLTREYPFDEDEVECILFEDLGPDAADAYRGGIGSDPTAAGSEGSGLGQKAGAARDDAKARIDRTRLRMAAGTDEVRARASEARRKAMRRAASARHAVSQGAQRAAARTGDMVERYPLSVLALGVAAGAALGAGIPSTDAEDRLMGEHSDSVKRQADDVKKQAGDAARAKADEAKRAAKAAGTAARDEVHEQGIDPKHMTEKGRAVKERAQQAAQQESGRQGSGTTV